MANNRDKHRASQGLQDTRVRAAKESQGTSSDPIYKALLRQVRASGAKGHALDFGAGTGHLASLLTGTGRFSQVDAVDIVDYRSDPSKSAPQVRWFFSDLNDPLPSEDGSYDLIVAAEVIEHLENPRFLAREWFRLLRDGGTLIYSTPNNESWRSLVSLLIKGHFAGFTDTSYPAHLTALVRKDLERVAREAGFSQVSFAFTHSGGVPGKPSFTWQRISRRLRGLRYSDNVVCIARKNALAP